MNVRNWILVAAALVLSCGWAQAQTKDGKAAAPAQGLGGKVVELGVTPNPKTGAPYNVNDTFADPGAVVVAVYSGNTGQWPDYDALLGRVARNSKNKVGVVKVDSKNLASSQLMRKLNLS